MEKSTPHPESRMLNQVDGLSAFIMRLLRNLEEDERNENDQQRHVIVSAVHAQVCF